MKKSGKLLKITDDRSIYIIQNEDGSYIDSEYQIRYRNLGESFEMKLIQESYVSIDQEKGMVNVLDGVGKSKFHFPLIWLDTDYMKYVRLVESGKLKIEQNERTQ